MTLLPDRTGTGRDTGHDAREPTVYAEWRQRAQVCRRLQLSDVIFVGHSA